MWSIPDTHSIFVAYSCDAMLLLARACACTTYSGRQLHAWQYLLTQCHQVHLQALAQHQYHTTVVHTSAWPWCLQLWYQWYGWSQSFETVLKELPISSWWLAPSHKMLENFLCEGIFLMLFVGIHLFLASFHIFVLQKRTLHELQSSN